MNAIVKSEGQEQTPNNGGIPSGTVLEIISRAATNPDVDIEKMRALLDMQKEIFAHEAKMQFARAMAIVQGKVPQIVKKSENKQTNSMYAKLEAICKELVPIASENGFSMVFGTGTPSKEHWVKATCKLMHSGGHQEDFEAEMPFDTTGIAGKTNKTEIHGAKSAYTYARTMLTCLMFNVTTKDDISDDDGNAAGRQPETLITEHEAANLQALIEETGADKAKFLGFFKVESVTQLPKAKLKQATEMLEKRRNHK